MSPYCYAFNNPVVFNDPSGQAPEGKLPVHTVSQGETLTQISDKYGVTVEGIAQHNPNIKDINEIQPGQQLIIPSIELAEFEVIYNDKKGDAISEPNNTTGSQGYVSNSTFESIILNYQNSELGGSGNLNLWQAAEQGICNPPQNRTGFKLTIQS